MPSSLIDAIRAERAKYGATLTAQQEADICNAVAWAHRADGWGLSRKPSGNHGVLSNGTPVATDILYHQPSKTVYDVLVGDDRHAGFNQVPPEKYDFPGRPWVAPVAPGGVPQPQPTPTPTPAPHPDNSGAILAALADLARRVKALEARPQVDPHDGLSLRVATLEMARYVAQGQTGRSYGHAHTVTLPVTRVEQP